MTDPTADDEPLSPAQAQIVARMRWLMVISGAATLLGIAVVVSVIGYRLFKRVIITIEHLVIGRIPPLIAGSESFEYEFDTIF
jgi:hypothetical protein